MFPVVPELLDVLSESELPSSEVVGVVDPDVEDVDPDEVGVAVLAALPPGRSCATTIPIATVAPVAAITAPRVSIRRRNLALSLSVGVFAWLGGDMRLPFLGLGMPRRPLPHHARIDPDRGPAVDFL